MARGDSIRKILSSLDVRKPEVREKLGSAFSDEYGIGREDTQSAFYRERQIKGLQREAPMAESMLSTYPASYRTREAMGMADPAAVQARAEYDMGLKSDPGERVAQAVGTAAADVTQDKSRSIYWLMNALQATGQVINDAALNFASKGGLYSKSPVINPDTGEALLAPRAGLAREEMEQRLDSARKAGILIQGSKDGKLDDQPRRKYSTGEVPGGAKGESYYTKRDYEPGHIAALAIPTGFAINQGLGLMTPFGGYEGYKAVIPDEEDPSKSANPIGEVAAKYIMGRTGNLLPYDEFVKVRPDVSREEYNRYKAFKFDKEGDLNPLDGDITIPTGVLKYTNEGIHGPEVQMLGRSLPVTTGVIPFASGVVGGMLGVAGKNNTNRVKRGMLGSVGGVVGGEIVGHIIENERRRRNAADNELNGIPQ